MQIHGELHTPPIIAPGPAGDAPAAQEQHPAPGPDQADAVELARPNARVLAEYLGADQGAAAAKQAPAQGPPAAADATAAGAQAANGPEAPADAEKSPLAAGGQDLTEEEQREVEKLRERDREVRAHEQAHVAAAGSHARGGPTYEYQRGPDNRQYAIGGEVQIDTSPVPNDPEATVRKAQTIRRAALAPAEPSPQDRRVAAEASQMEAEARREISQQRLEEAGGALGGENADGAQGAGNTEDAHAAEGDDATTRPAPTTGKFVSGASGGGAAGALFNLVA